MLVARARMAGRIALEIFAARCLYGSNKTHAILSAVKNVMGTYQNKVTLEWTQVITTRICSMASNTAKM